MDAIPPLAAGFVRLELRFRLPGTPPTPGDVVRASTLAPDDVGPLMVAGLNALIDVRGEAVQRATNGLLALGQVRVADWNFRWLRMAVGRNHGLTIGQLRKTMAAVDGLPLGKFNINNTHTMVGVMDQKIAAVAQRLGEMRINGAAVKPEVLAHGSGPGSASFSAGD